MNEETIFAAALKIDSEGERQAFLETACGGDAALRAGVEALLRAHEAAGSFMNRVPADLERTVETDGIRQRTSPCPAELGALPFLEPCDAPGRIGKLGAYEIVEAVGRGGMGIVLRAMDTKLSRAVAIKVLAPELAANPMAVKRFLSEAQKAAAVVHEHVITIHAVDDAHHPPFLVMEFIQGQTLQQKIDREGALGLMPILRIGGQVAEGLAAAHGRGLIHRDVKPANILLENGVERVKIADFGLARAADDAKVTQTGCVTGTPEYMSPEQAQGEPVDHRSDLFSLGSVLYTMCTGRPAFRADSTVAVLRRVCDDTPRPIRQLNPEIPDWLVAIIDCLLEKDRQRRFQSADEVAELLGRHLAQLQSPSQVPPPRLRLSPKARASASRVRLRTRVLTVLIGMVLLVGLGGVIKFTCWPTPTWQQLFNGKDLNGWKIHPDQPGGWSVVSGCLVGHGTVSHLFSDRDDFADFHLRAEVKINEAGNSGVYSRSGFRLPNRVGDQGFPDGYEAQICMVAPPFTGAIYGLASCSDRLTAPDEWFTLEVFALGNHIRTRVNGADVADYWDNRVDSPIKGHLALQVATPETVVQFRKIEIRRLESDDDVPPPGPAYVLGRLDVESDQTRVRIRGVVPVDTWETKGRYYPRMVRGNGYTIEVDDAKTGRLIRRERFAVTPGREVQFSVSGLVEGVGPEPERACQQELLYDTPVWYLAFSPNGDMLAIAKGSWPSDPRPEAVILLKRAAGKWQQAGRLEAHQHTVRGLAFHPKESILASIGWDGDRGGAVVVWDLATGKPIRRLGTADTFGESVAFSSDGATLLVTNGNGSAELLDWRKGTCEATLQAHRIANGRHAAAMSPLGRLFVTGSTDPSVSLWDLDARKKVCDLPGHMGYVFAVAFDREGKRLASGGWDRKVLVWDVGLREPVVIFDNMSVISGLAFSPDGRVIASAGADQTVRFWKAAGGSRKPIGHFFAHWGPVECLAFSPDGKTMATCSLKDRSVRLWDVSDILAAAAKDVK